MYAGKGGSEHKVDWLLAGYASHPTDDGFIWRDTEAPSLEKGDEHIPFVEPPN
jgi:hypothetical protein